MRTALIRLLVLVLAAASSALFAPPADACTEKCVRVDEFCWHCVDIGSDVGATCVQATECICYYAAECPYPRARSADSPLSGPAFLTSRQTGSTEVRPADRCAPEPPLLLDVPAA